MIATIKSPHLAKKPLLRKSLNQSTGKPLPENLNLMFVSGFVEVVVNPPHSYQFRMSPTLHNWTLLDDTDEICCLDGWESVGDHQTCSAFTCSVQSFLYDLGIIRATYLFSIQTLWYWFRSCRSAHLFLIADIGFNTVTIPQHILSEKHLIISYLLALVIQSTSCLV